jgi:pyoverdine/dityrosine biosynthesis protein Dit1
MNDVQKAKLIEIRRLLDEASTEYTEAYKEQQAAERKRDLAYRKVTDFIRQEQDVLLLRTSS